MRPSTAGSIEASGTVQLRPKDDRLLTADEVAKLLRVTPAWVYAETRRHRIPHLRLGRYVRFRQSALDAWMQDVERSSQQPRTPRRR